MVEKHGANVHPRLIMTKERLDAIKKHREGDGSVTGKALYNLRVHAYAVLNEPIQEYVLEGVRLLEASKRVTRRLIYTALAYNIFGEEKYAERAYRELEAAIKFPDWNPKHFLDPCEMVLGFAFAYDWLYDWMTQEQRNTVKTAIVEKALNTAMDDFQDLTTSNANDSKYHTYKWYKDKPGSNWKLVNNGSLAIAALAIGDEPDVQSLAEKVLTYTFDDAYDFIRYGYSKQDGAFREGLGYWEYATNHLAMHVSSLMSATGTDYNLADYIGLQKSAEFLRYMSSNTYRAFSFGNDWNIPETDLRIPVLMWFGTYYNQHEYSAMRVEKIADGGESYMDLLWLDEDKMTVPIDKIATDWGSVGTSNASFRNSLGVDGIISVLHVGENNYKYTWHYDLGQFFIESEGERFFTDLGPENYDIENHRYSYRMRAEGHNTLVINPSADLDQKDPVNCVINHFKSGSEPYAISDLTEAYEPMGAKSIVRGMKMIKEKKTVII